MCVPAEFKSKLPVLRLNFLRKVAQGEEGGRRVFVWTLDLFVVATTTLVVASMDCLLMLKHKIL